MVGFKLPAGALTVFGYRMDLTAEPWGPTGGSVFGSLNPDPRKDPDGYARWRELHARRYGPAKEGDPSVISFPGFEHPQFQSYLEQIALRNPGWFERNLLGVGLSGGRATLQEIFDAQAWSERSQIVAEGKRLFQLDGAGEPVKPRPIPPVTPPPPPASAPAGPPLSPLEVRVEELRSHVYQATGLVDDYLSPDQWPAFRPLAVEGLRVWRLLRRFLGDTRELPN